MSIEAALKKLTEAVEANTAAILSQPAAPASASPAPQPSPSRTGKGGRRSAASKSEAKPEIPAVELKQVQDATLKLVEVAGRDAAVGALGEFNVKKASELSPAQYPAVLKALTEKIEAAQAEPEPAADDLV